MISFFQQKNKKQKASLQAQNNFLKNKNEKKISWRILQKGSMTVEAALLMPIFFFAVLNLLSIADIIRVHSNIQAAMTETAKEMAVYGYVYDKVANEEIEKLVLSILNKEIAKKKVRDYAGREYLDNSVVKNGSEGLWFIKTDIMYQDDMIDLTVRYRVRPIFHIASWNDIFMINRCRMHAWTGYDTTPRVPSGEENKRIVYVAEYGEVYHTTKSCPHLRLSIEAIDREALAAHRNIYGEKFTRCEKCGKEKEKATLYITDMGNKYHTTLSCSGLKRTIREIEQSQTQLPPCKKCG